MNNRLQCLALLVLFTLAVPVHADDDANEIKKRKQAHEPKLSALDNSTLKIGVDLHLGGAITHLSRSGRDENLVNNWDWGRQIQMSHYSGPASFRVESKAVAKAWETFPWNPVQAGDHFGHASKLLDSRNDGKEIYVKCRPMQWSLEDAPSECIFESWARLDGTTVRARCRLTAARSDKQQYPAFSQEMPALYLNAPYHRLFSYVGDRPFAGGDLTHIEKDKGARGDFPWSRFAATENWAALVNDDDWGVGVYQPACVSFLGGFVGQPGHGGAKDSPTGYIAPVRSEIIDHNIVFEYEYVLIVGKLTDIRKQVYDMAGEPRPPVWAFKNDRQGWTYENATDAGWPIRGELVITPNAADGRLIGPAARWSAATAPTLKIDAALPAAVARLKVFWAEHGDRGFTEAKSTVVPVKGDGEFQLIEVKLSERQDYKGLISQLRVDLLGARKGEQARVRSISLR